jgi:UDP-N-acetylmuramate--alanine ligase
MMLLKDIKRIYFAGIGGIGMSAIARFFLSKGVAVSGYDKTPTSLTRQLEAEGAAIHYTEDVTLLDKDVQLVVYTPAIPANHAELNWYRANQYPVVKRSDVLQIITENSFNICIAGTHGKTSISTMVGHLLRHSGYGCNAFLGGISVNYQTNFWSSANNVAVVEADEYDRSFLKLSPDIAVVTAMDADHLDIYGTVEAMREAFVAFAGRLRPGGLLIRKHHLVQLDEAAPSRLLSYKLSNNHIYHTPVDAERDDQGHHHHAQDIPADVYATNIRIQQGGYLFDAHVAGTVLPDLHLQVGGLHNIENMLVAICIARVLRISDELIKAGVASYQGVRRRFEYVLAPGTQANGRVMIDDYAHHPEELRALISSARQLFPGRHMQVLFQPHLYSRTRDLAAAFANVLSLADEVVLLPIYPARELPIEGVSSQLIADKMPAGQCRVMEREEWLQHLAQQPPALLITAGAGDIDLLLPQAKRLMMIN